VKLLLATNNQGKISEFLALLAGTPVDLTTPRQEGLSLDVEETGATLEENAALKALAFSRASGLTALADDSGLFVDALGGEPGVNSARYAGLGATDEQRVALLLRNLSQVPAPRRTASFRCVIAIATPDGAVHYAKGECHGIISQRPIGEKGFGYDPVFYFPDLGKTMAELDSEAKNAVSHRGRATRAALTILQDLLKGPVSKPDVHGT
jgi:XTP/dITP diphosphohydrolase